MARGCARLVSWLIFRMRLFVSFLQSLMCPSEPLQTCLCIRKFKFKTKQIGGVLEVNKKVTERTEFVFFFDMLKILHLKLHTSQQQAPTRVPGTRSAFSVQ